MTTPVGEDDRSHAIAPSARRTRPAQRTPAAPRTHWLARARWCAVWLPCVVAIVLACAPSTDVEPPEPAPDPSPVALGSAIPDVQVTDRHFLPRFLSEAGPGDATVLVFTAAGCPLAARYLPRLGELERTYRDRGVRFVGIDVGPASMAEAMDQAFEHGVEFHFVKDFEGAAAASVGATRSPQVVVLDAQRVLRYRGRVDGQYRLAGVRPDAGRADLIEALEDVLAGREVRVPETATDGCPLEVEEIAADGTLTWSEHVGPLFARHCAPCHEPGAPGPFRLDDYDSVFRRRGVVAEVVKERRMPPWYAHPDYGRFANDRSLSPRDRRTILAWLAADAPQGAVESEPVPEVRGEWRIGKPDLVLEAPSTEVPADGFLDYVNVELGHVFERDTWVEAVEILPSQRSVVHHAQAMYVEAERLGQDQEWFRWGRLLAVYVPGREAVENTPGTAFLIPAGSALGLQIHYVPNGRAVVDAPRVGLRFPRLPVQQRLRCLALTDVDLVVPPMEPAFAVSSQRSVDKVSELIVHSVLPHMHLRGRDAELRAVYPDRREEILLRVPNYNFDWQLDYHWPPGAKRFPPGTEFRFSARFDNSSFNAFNPDPSAEVPFGERTTDEMFYAWLFYTVAGEQLALAVDPHTGQAVSSFQREPPARPNQRPAGKPGGAGLRR